MPRLPGADRQHIDRRKLTHYLLSAAHPVGRGKARFFAELGFSATDPDLLDAALRVLALDAEAVETQDTGFGIKYIADGQLRGPTATAPVRTVWIIEHGSETPRFVTAYPRSGL